MAPALFRAMFSLLIRYILVIITVVIGALIFTEIENMGVEEERKKLLHKVAASKIAKHKLLTDLATRLNTTVNDSFLEEIIEKVQNLSTATVPNKWEFSTGAYFAFTIISTIGYGVIVPTTDYTRIITIIYALIGIPIFLYAMAAAGNVKTLLGEGFYHVIEVKLLKRSEVRHKKLKIVLFALVACSIELMAASAFVYHEEEWSFFIAFYFWFVSASTIGFGDYVLSFNGNNRINPGLLVLIFFITLVLMSDLGCIFSTISEIIAEGGDGSRKTDCLHGKCCRKRQNSVEISEQINMEKL